MKMPVFHTDFKSSLLRISLPAFVLFAGILIYISLVELDNVRSRNKIIQENLIRENVNIIHNTLNQIVSDLNYLSDMPGNVGFSPGATIEKNLLETYLLSFSQHRKMYDQIRLLDYKGFELVRVNNRSGELHIVASDQLQYKGDRYYFGEMQSMAPDEIYVSPVDLNVDNGKIEVPLNPVIRVAKKIRIPADTAFLYLVLNYRAEDMLARLSDSSLTATNRVIVLNEEGYYLKGLHTDSNWHFMYEDTLKGKFANDFFREWEAISGPKRAGHMQTSAGMFSFYKYDYCNQLLAEESFTDLSMPRSCHEWVLISFTNPEQMISGLYKPVYRKYILFAAIGAVGFILFTLFFSNIRSSQMEERRKRQAQFRFMQLLIETLPNPIFFVDYDNDEFGCNEAFEQLTGKNRRELREMHIEKLFRDSERQGKKKKLGKNHVRVSEMKLNYPDGTPHHLLYYKANISFEDKKIGLVGVFNDITSIRKAENALRESESKLRAANRTKNRFFSLIAHDLKNPFHAILGLSHLLYTNFDEIDNDDRIHVAENIYRSTENTYQLLLNLLDWARLQEGKIKSKPGAILFGELANDTIALQKTRIEEKKLEVSFAGNASEKIWADENMVRTVLRNLLSNSIRFTETGGKISILTRKAGEEIEIEVRDNGIGIAPEIQKNLFRIDIQGRPNSSDEKEGTGLGLLLCKDFVALNRGKIWVESESGKGTSFFFTLPLARTT